MSGVQTVLTIAQSLADSVGIPRPSALVSSTDEMARQLLFLITEAGRDLRREYAWIELVKEHTFTTVSGTASYAFPGDFERFHENTGYDRAFSWAMTGPLVAEEWQYLKSGLVGTSPYRQYRFKGYTSTQFFLHPTPSDTGSTLVYEYQSSNWILPLVWTASYTFGAATYCSYNGVIYYTSSGGVTGATPPTHTTGSTSDGAVTWTYVNTTDYQRFLADTDKPVLNYMTILKWAKALFLKSQGLDYMPALEDARKDADVQFASTRGARTIHQTPVRFNLLSQRNQPDTLTGF